MNNKRRNKINIIINKLVIIIDEINEIIEEEQESIEKLPNYVIGTEREEHMEYNIEILNEQVELIGEVIDNLEITMEIT